MAAPSSTHCRGAAVSTEDLNHCWVASNAALAEATAHWGAVVGLDTEFQRTDTFFPIPGLYQLSSTSGIWLIDPLAIDDWAPLAEVLEDPNRVKVIHSCSEDLALIRHHLGIAPANLFDTQIAHAFLSEHLSLSYADLVEANLGHKLPKHQTRSDWLQRPLSAGQRRYACEDVASLPALHSQLRRALEDRGRWPWFHEEMVRRERPLQDDPEEYFVAVKGAWRLSAEELGALRSLCAWRERKAAAEDRPRRRVVWDEHLLEFARAPVLTTSMMASRLPRRLVQRYAEELRQAHQQGRARPEQRALPGPLNRTQSAAVKQMQEIGRAKALALGMAPELLARKRDLEACVRCHAHNGGFPEAFRGWRGALVGAEFSNVLKPTKP